jgi:hypothetical protein
MMARIGRLTSAFHEGVVAVVLAAVEGVGGAFDRLP